MTACAFVLMVAVALANAGAPTAAADICEDAAKVFTPPQAVRMGRHNVWRKSCAVRPPVTVTIRLVVACCALTPLLSQASCTYSFSLVFFLLDSQAVACYTGNFLAKMLGELNAGNNKTVEHVRVHLLPYLGGVATLAALRTDSPDTPTCTVCYADNATADGLTQLRNLLTPEQLASYDNLKVRAGSPARVEQVGKPLRLSPFFSFCLANGTKHLE